MSEPNALDFVVYLDRTRLASFDSPAEAKTFLYSLDPRGCTGDPPKIGEIEYHGPCGPELVMKVEWHYPQ